jgi:nuclear pore complex protein Nup98-Nup96
MQGRKTAGAFGQSAAFGTTTTAAPTTNIFGAPAQSTAQPSTSIFGNTNTNTNAFGAFGQNTANQPATTTGTGLFGAFGQQQQQQQPGSTGFGGFGQLAQQPQTQTGTNAFGGGAFSANKPNTFSTFATGWYLLIIYWMAS